MLLSRQGNRPRAGALFLTAAALAAATAGNPGGARADTASDLAAATAEVEQLQGDAAAAHERQEAAEAELGEVTARLADLDASLQTATAEVADSRRSLGRAARASYIGNGVEGSLLLLLTTDAETFGRGLHDLKRVNDAAAADLDSARSTEAELTRIRTSIAQEQAAADRLTQEAARAAGEAAGALAEAERREQQLQQRYAAELAALRAAQEEQARQEAAAARALLEQAEREAAAQAAAAQAAAQAAEAQAGQPAEGQGPAAPPPVPAAPVPPVAPPPAAAATGTRGQLVEWALNRVGSRYVINGEGPNAFDCSGFVTAAYRTIGVSVPSYTGAQAKRVAQIPLSQAKPGDLLFFFGRGAQHVALYIGNGRMVHAANPSRGVTVNNVNDPWYGERFTMAGRLID